MISSKVKKSPVIIILFIVSIVGLIISLMLSYEDYWSSYLGYVALPTRKANDWIYYAAALVPQIGQIIFGYSFIAGEKKPWKILIVIFLHIADVGTDVYFKAYGSDITVWGIALLESETLFTLGSEVMLTTAFAMAADIFPAFVSEIGKLFGSIFAALGSGDNEHEKGGNPNKNENHGGSHNNNNNNGNQRDPRNLHNGQPNNQQRNQQQNNRKNPVHHPMGREARQNQAMQRNVQQSVVNMPRENEDLY